MRTSRIAVALVTALAAGSLLALVVVAGSDRDDDGATSTTRPSTSTGIATSTTTTSLATTTTPTTAPTTPSSAPDPGGEAAVALRRGNPDRAVVALTFDAGSDTGYAAEILDTLAAKDVQAAFGVTGRWVEANPALVRRMLADGHQLVNHSYDHPSFTGRSTGAPTAVPGATPRSAGTDRAGDRIGRRRRCATRGSGRRTATRMSQSALDVGSAGYRYELLWTIDSLGWKGEPADAVTRRCLDGAVPGAIYLFHVGAASTDHAALPAIIDGLRARGIGFTTPAEMVLDL